MSRNMLDQDFGSEEEDDDFNPAPAFDSDNEDARVSTTDMLIVAGDANTYGGYSQRIKTGTMMTMKKT